MTTVAAVSERAAAPRAFYLIMALVLAGLVVAGFSQTVPGDFSTPGFPLFLALHGVVFFAWVVLFVAQPTLAMRGAIGLHRKLGWVGVGLAAAMAVLGAGAVLMGLVTHHLPQFYRPELFLGRGLMAVLVFSGLVVAGVAQRRRPGWHKRLMLCASIIVITPGLERAMPVSALGPHWSYTVDAVVLALALAGPAVETLTERRVHPASLWGVGAILAGQVAVDLFAVSPLASQLVRGLAGPA